MRFEAYEQWLVHIRDNVRLLDVPSLALQGKSTAVLYKSDDDQDLSYNLHVTLLAELLWEENLADPTETVYIHVDDMGWGMAYLMEAEGYPLVEQLTITDRLSLCPSDIEEVVSHGTAISVE